MVQNRHGELYICIFEQSILLIMQNDIPVADRIKISSDVKTWNKNVKFL
jgi:hypothetical protein